MVFAIQALLNIPCQVMRRGLGILGTRVPYKTGVGGDQGGLRKEGVHCKLLKHCCERNDVRITFHIP